MGAFSSRQGGAGIAIDILPPERAMASRRLLPRRGEVIDVRFETIGRHPAFHGADSDAGGVLADIEARLKQLPVAGFAAAVALASIATFGFSGGFSGGISLLSGYYRPAADVAALDITHGTLTPQDANGMRVLLINGIVANRGADRVVLPPLRAELVSGGDVVAELTIAPPAAVIEPGQSRGFAARLPHPGGGLPQLKLSLTQNPASTIQ